MGLHLHKTIHSMEFSIRYTDENGIDIDTGKLYRKKETCERWIKKQASKQDVKKYFIKPIYITLKTITTEKDYL